MIIDGKLIASELKVQLKDQVSILRSKKIIPHLAVILIGNDPSSITYIKQKQKAGIEIGAEVSIYRFDVSESDKDTSDGVRSTPPRWRYLKEKLINLVNKLNIDPLVHGIIIQLPIPIDISKEELDRLVIPQKDVDGFHPKTKFAPPVALAVFRILEYVYMTPKSHFYAIAQKCVRSDKTPRGWQASPSADGEAMTPPMVEELNMKFVHWLKEKKILVIGRGETAGKPIADYLLKKNLRISIAHSQTTDIKKLCLSSDIIITCVGRANIVRHDMVNKITILIGVGLHPENDKLQTDYDQSEIASKVAYYTPVPGGVGPVNVACLFENLLFSCKLLK